MRFPPKGSEGLLFTEKDGLPNVDVETFENDCPVCPTQIDDGFSLKQECVDGTHGWKKGGCACGVASNKHESSCHKCVVQHLVDKKTRPDELKCPIMSRRQIVERALGYVLLGTQYHNGWSLETCASDDVNPHCPMYGFQAVCNGFIDMVWSGGPGGCQEKIPCNQMQPGDHIYTKHHQMLFRKWKHDDAEENGNARSAVVYQMGGFWGKANVAFHRTTWGDDDDIVGSHCFRRLNLTDSSPAPYPPFPPVPSPPSPTPPSPSPMPTPTPVPTPTPTPVECSFDVKEETCYGGTTIKKVAGQSVDECCAACLTLDDCTHFTFTPGSSTCGLKSGVPVGTDHTHCTSGVMTGPMPSPVPMPTPTPVPTPTPTPVECSFDVKEETCYGGTTIKKVAGQSVDECCAACLTLADCTHFTFTPGSSTCGLKSGIPVGTDHTHCTSGVMTGPTPSPAPMRTPTLMV